MADSNQYDLIIFGASSFVGRLLTAYLLKRHGENGALRWALAGRSATKLQQLKTDLNITSLPTIIADAHDEAALTALCEQTRLVVSTVGPYMLYGSTLVKVCAISGTDYCDLTGESPWIRQMMDAHAQQAEKSGARIVHCCGFDSIPSDIGVWHLQQQAMQRFGEPAKRVRMRVKAIKGGVSGGTVASMMNMAEQARSNSTMRHLLANPFALLADPTQSPSTRQPKVTLSEYDNTLDRWAAPFVMSAINEPIVHRSNQLQHYAYGEDFCYHESVLTGAGWRGRGKAVGTAIGTGAFFGLASFSGSRWLLNRFVVPAPGEGPSPKAQAHGLFNLQFIGETANGNKIHTEVTGKGDPGYASTSKMLGEAALTLSKDTSHEQIKGGFWTPAAALGERLYQRLIDHAELNFKIIE